MILQSESNRDVPKLPNAQCQAFLERAIERVRADGRFVGLLVAGSVLSAEMDEFSDLDLIVVCRPETLDSVMQERRVIAASLGRLLAAFTGEHVGEPALLICLYDDPLLHVDLKFIVPQQLARRVENPRIAWTHGTEVLTCLRSGQPQWPNVPPEWFEERFWIWVHYGAQKLARGELFEAIEMIGFLRQQILGPMNARRHGRDQRGVRRVEHFAPDFAVALRRTLCTHERTDVLRALSEAISLYLELRAEYMPDNASEERTRAVLTYLAELRRN
jgi:hypothetical protein